LRCLWSLALVVVLAACQSSTSSEQTPTGSDPSSAAPGDHSTPGSHDVGRAPGDTTPVDPDDVAAVPSDFDVADHVSIDEAGVPESSAHEPSGNFRFICDFSHLAYDDPIVYPGQPGASHLHMFFGNDEADAFSTYDSLRADGGGSCQGGPVNRSAYWAPVVFNADGDVLRPEFITVYYKGPGTARDGSILDVQDLPPGLRMIAGYDAADPATDSRHEWNCEVERVNSERIPDCPADELVGVSLPFPTCWNGTQLDAPDHRSHMAYEVYDTQTGIPSCPSTHPVPLPAFTLGIWFEHDGRSSQWHLSSDEKPDGTRWPSGTTFHADWFGAWDPDVQLLWTDTCINGLLNCSTGQLGDGTALDGLPDYDGPNVLAAPARPQTAHP
jgi:hypothetical protein